MSNVFMFGNTCYILSDRNARKKLVSQTDEGMFHGYSTHNRAYMMFKKCTNVILKLINVVIDDAQRIKVPRDEDEVVIHNTVVAFDIPVDIPNNINNTEDFGSESSEDEDTIPKPLKEPSSRIKKNHIIANIIGNIN